MRAKKSPEDKALTQREALFVQHYTTGETMGKPKEAAIAAGYAENRVHVTPYQLLARPNIAKAIAEAQERIRAHLVSAHAQAKAEAEIEAGVTLVEVVNGLAQMMRADPATMFNDDGTVKPMTEWDLGIRQLVTSFDAIELTEGAGEDFKELGTLKKIKLAPKMPVFESLMKHMGGYAKDNKQRQDEGVTAAFAELARAIQAVQGNDSKLPISAGNPG